VVKSNQIKSNQIRSDQIRSNQIRSDQTKSDQINKGKLKNLFFLPKNGKLLLLSLKFSIVVKNPNLID